MKLGFCFLSDLAHDFPTIVWWHCDGTRSHVENGRRWPLQVSLQHKGCSASLARADMETLPRFHATPEVQLQSQIATARASLALDLLLNLLFHFLPCGRLSVHLACESAITALHHIVGGASLFSSMCSEDQLCMIATRASHLTQFAFSLSQTVHHAPPWIAEARSRITDAGSTVCRLLASMVRHAVL